MILLLLTPGTLIVPDLILADDQQTEPTYSRSDIIELLKKNQADSSEESVILVEAKMISHATSTRQTRKFLAVSHGNSQAQFFSCFDVSDLDRSPDQTVTRLSDSPQAGDLPTDRVRVNRLR